MALGPDTHKRLYKRGVDLRQMIRLPLLPPPIREGLINNMDVSNVIRDNLRELLGLNIAEGTLPENKIIENEYQGNVGKIREVEWNLMRRHARLLQRKEILFSCLPRHPNLREIDLPRIMTQEYNLISIRSLIPYLRADREGSVFETYTEEPCNHLHALRENVFKKVIREIQQPYVKKEKISTPISMDSQAFRRKIAIHVLPEEVAFENYSVGNTYMVNVKLQNSGENSAMLKFVLPKDPAFEVSWARKHNVLAPGLSVMVTVYFHCKDKDNHFDKIQVQPGGGTCVTIPIKAMQISPCLLSAYYTGSLTDQLLKSTIDCGKCYVGSVTEVKTVVYNPGSPGKFFILSELSWYFNTVKDTTEENVLVQKPFYIQPAHFTINHRKKRNLKVVFSPMWEGSHLIQVFVLCDNVTMRSLDIVGESVMYDPSLFVIEDLEKSYNVFVDEDLSADYYLHLGRLISYSTASKSFFIANASIVETKFRWEITKADIPNTSNLLPENCSIFPFEGSLCSEDRMQFTISCCSNDMPAGKYVAIFTVYLEGIPKIALKETERTEDTNEELVTLCLGRIEVRLDVDPPNVCLWPNYLYFFDQPNVWNNKKLYVTNYENETVYIKWRVPHLSGTKILLCPWTNSLTPHSSTVIYVVHKSKYVGRFAGYISAEIKQSLSTFQVFLECETVLTLSSGMSEIKDFGILRKGELKKGSIQATFPTEEEVDLTVSHVSLRYDENDNPYFKKCNHISYLCQYPTTLKPDSPAKLVIKANTKVEQICIEVIEWKFCSLQAYTTILSDIQDLDISVFPPLLTINEKLYKGLEASFPIKIRNHRRLLTGFQWAGYFGPDMNCCKVYADPERADLPPSSEVEVLLVIIPTCLCFIQDLFYRFDIKYMTKPLIGAICGLVKESAVEVSWINDGKFISATWPEEECDLRHTQYPSLETVASEPSDINCDICFSEQFTADSTSHSISSGDKREANNMAYQDSETSSIPYNNWPYIGGKYYGTIFKDEDLRRDFEAPWTEESLTDRLKGIPQEERDAFLKRYSEMALVFDEVDTFQVYSHTFCITNLSPLSVTYKIKTNRYRAERRLPPLDPYYLGEMVFHDQGLGYEGCSPELEKLKWTHRVRKSLGLAIRVKEKKGVIAPRQVQTITVCVFSVVWGTYFDDIAVYADDHPPFHVPVLVRCHCPPAFFTFAPESKTPLLRFPSIRQQRTRVKTVYLENKCFFPLKIVWTVYIVPQNEEWTLDYCLPTVNGPDFGVNLELHPMKETDFCKLKLTRYVGQQECFAYRIEPAVLYLPPRTKAPVTITVDSRRSWYNFDHPDNKLVASALGIIYIDGDDWMKEEYFCCYRPDGYDINPITLKLETVVEILSFRVLNCSRKDAIFKVNTTEIFSSQGSSGHEHIVKRHYCIENYGKSEAIISVEVETPFVITAIKHNFGDEPDIHREFTVKSSETIEVEVLLQLNKNILTKKYEKNTRTSYLEMDRPIVSELNFGRKGEIENIINLEIHIQKPVFKFQMEKVNFGPTCLWETKVKDIHVYVEHGDQPFKVRIERNDEKIFIVEPTLGLMEEGKPTALTVSFTPRKCTRYENVIEFISTTPGSIYPLFVEGSGTVDHGFYS